MKGSVDWPFIGWFVGGAIAFALIGLAVVSLLRLGPVPRVVSLVYWTRYSVLLGVFLLAFPIVATFLATPILYGLLVLEHLSWLNFILKFMLVTWASLIAGFVAVTTYGVTAENAPARFGEAHGDDQLGGNQPPQTGVAHSGGKRQVTAVKSHWVCAIGLGLWIPGWCIWATMHEYASQRSMALQATMGVFLGVVVMLFLLWTLGLLQRWLFPTNLHHTGVFAAAGETTAGAEPSSLERFLVEVFARFGPGYTADGMLRPGHAQSLLLVIASVALYLLLYWTTWFLDAIPSDRAPFTALFFLLLIAVLFGFVLSGLSFFLDYYHVPTVLVLVLVVAASHSFFDTDHYFELNPERTTGPPAAVDPVSFDEAVAHRLFKDATGEGTMVVVAAEGGGIQAAAWTAQVLSGLEEELDGFGDAVGLVSGVSGGSVGLMFYLQGQVRLPSVPPEERAKILESIRVSAESSSLEATAWGTAFPDLMRLFFPFAVKARFDRGWALELDWRKRLASGEALDDTRLSDWAAYIRSGRMPIVAFNATMADTGQSLIISPVIERDDEEHPQLELLREYRDFAPDPRISTGARLSATFSYVSPICKPLRDGLSSSKAASPVLAHRVADGGYIDNSGLFTATRWTRKLIQGFKYRPPFKNIILLRIVPFPEAPIVPQTPADRMGLLWEVFGPVLTLNSARSGSQLVRGDWEMELLTAAFQGHDPQDRRQALEQTLANQLDALSPQQGPQFQQRLQDFRSALDARQFRDDPQKMVAGLKELASLLPTESRHAQIQLQSLAQIAAQWWPIKIYSLQIRPSAELSRQPPLSWKLTPSQKTALRDSWKALAGELRNHTPATDELPSRLEIQDLTLFFRPRAARTP